jgi:hypothetical protein
MLTGVCHCGAVRVEVSRRPRTLTECNCSICRRYGTQWAYYQASSVRVRAPRGATQAYAWGDQHLKFWRCSVCGCITHWSRARPRKDAYVGVNMRNFEPGELRSPRIRHLDGAKTWKYLD